MTCYEKKKKESILNYLTEDVSILGEMFCKVWSSLL